MSKSFWVIELTEAEKAPCPRYWSGSERGFVYDIGEAIQLVRKQDAERFLKHSHLSGHVAEHAMVARAALSARSLEVE